jgi:hypothetical protein
MESPLRGLTAAFRVPLARPVLFCITMCDQIVFGTLANESNGITAGPPKRGTLGGLRTGAVKTVPGTVSS